MVKNKGSVNTFKTKLKPRIAPAADPSDDLELLLLEALDEPPPQRPADLETIGRWTASRRRVRPTARTPPSSVFRHHLPVDGNVRLPLY